MTIRCTRSNHVRFFTPEIEVGRYSRKSFPLRAMGGARKSQLKCKLVALDSEHLRSAGCQDPYVNGARLRVYRIMTGRQTVQMDGFMALGEFYNGDGSIFVSTSQVYVAHVNRTEDAFASIHNVQLGA